MTADDKADLPQAHPSQKKPGFLRRWFGARGSSDAEIEAAEAALRPGAPPDLPPPEPDAEPPAKAVEPPPMAEPAPMPAAAPEPAPFPAAISPDAAPPPSDDGVLRDIGARDPDAFIAAAFEADPPFPEPLPGPTPPEPRPPLAPEPEAVPEAAAPRLGWWGRLRQGLARSSSAIGQGIVDIFAKRKLDAGTLEDLDDVLIRADLGVAMASRITEAVAKGRYDKAIDPEEVKAILAREVEAALAPVAHPLVIDAGKRPFTILVIGVNGSGKTTTIGKLAAKFTAAGHSVMLAAGDTFRAAAVEQLKVWGGRTGAPVITRPPGADAAGLAFDALQQARESGTDVLLIDTAGRLQNRTELMDELAKVIRVLRKQNAEAPHAVLLVLDATVGQNALSQVEIFGKVAGVTGLVMTKLDGTARGGILVAIADKHRLPVHFIGVGEGIDDLEPFAARDFARAIAGLEQEG